MTTTSTNCSVSTCAFHHPDNKCAAGEINVMLQSNQACCDTFIPRDQDTKPASGDKNPGIGMRIRADKMADDARGINMATASHIWEGDATNLSPLVSCSANNCQHNQHGVCFAQEMNIDGSKANMSIETKCSTYLPS